MKAFNPVIRPIIIAFPALVFVGCSHQDNSQDSKTEAYKPRTDTVEIIDMQFQPADLTVHAGDTVVWINRDFLAHDVTEENKAWASPRLASGDSWKKEITTSASYFCSIHLVMKGKLTVKE